jgi:hypothetical protein
MKRPTIVPVVASLLVIAALVATRFNSSSNVSSKDMNDLILQTCSCSRCKDLKRKLAATIRNFSGLFANLQLVLHYLKIYCRYLVLISRDPGSCTSYSVTDLALVPPREADQSLMGMVV